MLTFHNMDFLRQDEPADIRKMADSSLVSIHSFNTSAKQDDDTRLCMEYDEKLLTLLDQKNTVNKIQLCAYPPIAFKSFDTIPATGGPYEIRGLLI